MKRAFWVPLTLALAAYVALPLTGESKPLSERIRERRAQVEEKRLHEGVLSQTIARYDTRIEGLQGQIRAVRTRLSRVQHSLDRKRAELERTRDRLQVARDRLERVRRQLAVARRVLAARLVEIYKADTPDALTVVLEADGFADLLERTEFLDRISDQDREIVERVRVLRDRAARRARELAALERREALAARAILQKRDEIAGARDQLVSSQVDLRAARGDRRSALTRVRRSRVRLEGDLEALEREQARVRAALAAAAPRAFTPSGGGGPGSGAAPGPVRQGSGRLIWPLGGPLVSPFGMRWGRLHAGIDIAMPSGTPIRAADSGRVVLLGSVGGYGNYVCIQHTGSLSTCYAHLSGFATSNGAAVRQGQVIGYVGCTGHCFGDHLHFETRVNGSPVDPMGYL